LMVCQAQSQIRDKRKSNKAWISPSMKEW
jgi:hypothetical protein